MVPKLRFSLLGLTQWIFDFKIKVLLSQIKKDVNDVNYAEVVKTSEFEDT